MTDVFKQLQPLSFRGIRVPCSARRVSFEHEQVRHKYIFRDNELVEALGHKNWVFEYTIPFREDINKGDFRNLYVSDFPDFLNACRDRSEGELVDPELGTFVVRPVSVTIETDVNKRDGEDVQVSFVHSPTSEDTGELQGVLAGVKGAVSHGRQLDEQMANISNAQLAALGLTDTPETGVDFLDAVSGFGQQLVSQVNRTAARIDQVAYKVGKVADTVDDLNELVLNPQNAPTARSANRLKDQLHRLRDSVLAPGQKLISFVVRQDTPVGVLASQFKMDAQAFIAINPGIPMPNVPAGTKVRHLG